MKSISIHLTDQCNNSCVFCVVNSHKKKNEYVNRKSVKHFIKDNAGEYDQVNIHGGEPTIVKEFLQILEWIKDCGYSSITLQTNGRTLADIDFARKVCGLGVNLFVISIHGHARALHDGYTDEDGSFDEAVKGIENIKKLGRKVRTNTVITRTNYFDLDKIVQFILSLKVDHINISAMHPVGRAYYNLKMVTPSYSEIQLPLFKAVDLVSYAGIPVTLEGFPICTVPNYEKFRIDWSKNHFKLLFRSFVLNDYNTYMETKTRIKGKVCEKCGNTGQCGGFYKEYIELYGWKNVNPI